MSFIFGLVVGAVVGATVPAVPRLVERVKVWFKDQIDTPDESDR
jgi:hypothetical protein